MNIIYKTIKTRNRHYVYDRNANRILSIDESDYNKLLEQEKKIDKEFDDNFIRKFQEKGFLLENQLEIIENPLTRYSEHILNHYKEQLILQVTQRCNLRCEYCVYSEKVNIIIGSIQIMICQLNLLKRQLICIWIHLMKLRIG